MKYINQLTDDELKKLFVCLIKDFYEVDKIDDDCQITRDPYFITIRGNFDRGIIKDVECPAPFTLELDDFNVYSSYKLNWVMEKHYRKHMVWKFGKQYALDCFWDGLGGKDND